MARPGIDVITIGKIRGFLQGFSSSDSTEESQLSTIINAIGTRFEQYMKRYLYQTERTEYFDVKSVENLAFFPRGVPITAVAGYYDQDRSFSDAIDTDNCIIGPDEMSVLLVDGYAVSAGLKVLKLVYTGGLATSTINITANLTSITGSFTAGNTLKDGSNNTIGTVVSWDSDDDILVWTPTLTSATYCDEENGGTSVGDEVKEDDTHTGTISSFDTSNLLYDYPDIMQAALLQAQHVFTNKENAGREDVTLLGEMSFRTNKARFLIPEVKELLDPHRIRII